MWAGFGEHNLMVVYHSQFVVWFMVKFKINCIHDLFYFVSHVMFLNDRCCVCIFFLILLWLDLSRWDRLLFYCLLSSTNYGVTWISLDQNFERRWWNNIKVFKSRLVVNLNIQFHIQISVFLLFLLITLTSF